jgi:hypothetical protein
MTSHAARSVRSTTVRSASTTMTSASTVMLSQKSMPAR